MKGNKKSLYEWLKGKRMVFQLLRGMIITGTFSGLCDNFFIVTNAEIKGLRYICNTELVLIQKNQVQHFHVEGELREVEEAKEGTSKGNSS